jgi:NAD(P)-dependent dehydrogenase (short-subunit alcohol dehydrogenase family)
MTIADRAVLVTGANRGIGQARVEEAAANQFPTDVESVDVADPLFTRADG